LNLVPEVFAPAPTGADTEVRMHGIDGTNLGFASTISVYENEFGICWHNPGRTISSSDSLGAFFLDFVFLLPRK
jgi:hypothetical protein